MHQSADAWIGGADAGVMPVQPGTVAACGSAAPPATTVLGGIEEQESAALSWATRTLLEPCQFGCDEQFGRRAGYWTEKPTKFAFRIQPLSPESLAGPYQAYGNRGHR